MGCTEQSIAQRTHKPLLQIKNRYTKTGYSHHMLDVLNLINVVWNY